VTGNAIVVKQKSRFGTFGMAMLSLATSSAIVVKQKSKFGTFGMAMLSFVIFSSPTAFATSTALSILSFTTSSVFG